MVSQVLLQLSVRARNELRRQAEAGLHVVSAGPLLAGMLEESRALKPQPVHCAALERERRARAERAYSPRRPGVREYVACSRRGETAPALKQGVLRPPEEAEWVAPPDTRGAVQFRRSTLGEMRVRCTWRYA